MATSIDPPAAPNTNSAAASCGAFDARDIGISDKQKPKVLQAVTIRLPNRVTSQPHTGTATTEPHAVPSSVAPSSALFRPSLDCTAGMRVTHVDTTRPCTRNMTSELHQARRICCTY